MQRMGANGQPIPEKKEETLQEILEVNPNKKTTKKKVAKVIEPEGIADGLDEFDTTEWEKDNEEL